jgi:putative DNA primase/helicase
MAATTHRNQLPPIQTTGDFTRSDLGNAQRLYKAYGDRLAFDYAADRWFIWDGKVWSPDTEDAISRHAHSVVFGMLQQAVEHGDADYRDFAVRALSSAKIKALVESAKASGAFTVPSSQWDASPLVLNTPSGILYFEDGTGQVTLDAHTATAHCSRMTAAAYDPNAKSPTWDRFVAQVLPDEESRRYFQRLIGYAALGVRREQMISFSYGLGNNGKSTAFELLKTVLGSYAGTTAAASLLRDERNPKTSSLDPELIKIAGCRMVVASEMPENGVLDAAKIKAITGNDTLSARNLYKGPVEFRATFQLLALVNHRPRSRDNSPAFWRRVHVLGWNFVANPPDKNLPAAMLEEGQGVLRWIVEGASAYLREGLNPPAAVLNATAEYRAVNDQVATFLLERTTADPLAAVRAADLYRAYAAWCESAGERAQAQRSFGVALTERGLERGMTGPERNQTAYLGIRLGGAAAPALQDTLAASTAAHFGAPVNPTADTHLFD